MEISHGVHRLDGIRGANCYFVVNGKTTFLIDTGMPGNARKIIDQIGKLGWKPADIRMILITHPDIDHMGSLAELKRLTQATVAVHEEDAPILGGERNPRKVKGLLGLLLRAMIKLMRNEPVKPDLFLKNGDTVGPFTVIHTPGHTDGSICFYDAAKGVLFAGDTLRTDKKGNPCVSFRFMDADHQQAVVSLQKLSFLDFQIAAPGHGPVTLRDASAKIAALTAASQ